MKILTEKAINSDQTVYTSYTSIATGYLFPLFSFLSFLCFQKSYLGIMEQYITSA